MIALLLTLALHRPVQAPEPWGWNDLLNWCGAHGDACMRLAAPANYRPAPVTPGVARELTRDQVCDRKWGVDDRHVTEGMKRRVAAAYGIPPEATYRDRRGRRHYSWPSYEFDHLIPRELGGADDVSNLWPQPWTGDFNAHQKDALENRLHALTCKGEITLEFAQEVIRTDWIAAYRLYVRPTTPTHDVPDQRRRDAVRPRKSSLRNSTRSESAPDRSHVSLGQLGTRSRFSTTQRLGMALSPSASLLHHIGGVVGRSTQKEVVRANAGRRIAVMTHVEAVSNWAVVQRPRESVGAPLQRWANIEGTVATRQARSRPQPTSIGFLYVLPETNDRVFTVALISTDGAAVLASLRLGSHIRVATDRALSSDLKPPTRTSARLSTPRPESLLHRPEDRSAVASALAESSRRAAHFAHFRSSCRNKQTVAFAGANRCHALYSTSDTQVGVQ